MTTTRKSGAKKSPKNASASDGGRKVPMLAIGFVVVAALLIAAIAFSGSDPIGSEFGDPEVSGEGLPLFAGTTSSDPAIGMQAPELTGADFDGNVVEIRHDGTPKAIAFLAHWCPHCQVEVPKVQQWLNATGGVDGVDMYSVSTAMNSAQPNYPPSEWLDREGWTVPVILDDQESTAHRAFGSGGFPFWVFLDGDGKVVARSSGELPIDVLAGFLTTLAAGVDVSG